MKNSFDQIMIKYESQFAVEKIMYDNLPLWPYLRSVLLYKAWYKGNERLDFNTKREKLLSKWRSLKIHLHSILYTNYFLFFKKEPILLFVSSSQFKSIDGKVINKLTGYIEEKFENILPIVQIDLRHKNKLYEKQCIDEMFIDDFLLFKARKKPLNKTSLYGEDVLREIILELQIEFDYITYIAMVVYGIEFYLKWFRRVKPQLLIAECYYDMKMPAIYAAKKLGIATIEVQHGIINKEVFPYNSAKDFTDNPYPDWLLSYGEIVKEEVKNGKIFKESKVIPVGNYYLTLIEERTENTKVFRDKYKNLLNKKIMVVVSQEPIDRKLIDISKKLASILEDFAFIYVTRKIEEYHEDEQNIDFYIENELDICQLMQNAHITMSVYSTCVMESLFLGTPVLLMDIDGLASGYYKKWLDDVHSACIVATLEEALRAIVSLAEIEKEEVKREATIFYKDNYRKNIDAALREIVK